VPWAIEFQPFGLKRNLIQGPLGTVPDFFPKTTDYATAAEVFDEDRSF
jgi:hypothetical protein